MNEHRSARAQYESSQDQQFHVFVYETSPVVRHRFTRFPVMPDWWLQDDPEVAERRAAIYVDFDSSEITGVIVDLAARIDGGIPESANDVAAYVRRHQALEWLVDVGHGWLQTFQHQDGFEHYTRYWMLRSGKFLHLASSLFLQRIPQPLLAEGADIARAECWEVEELEVDG